MTSAGLGAPATASAQVGESAPPAPRDERAIPAWLSAIPYAGLAAWLLGPPLGYIIALAVAAFYVAQVRLTPAALLATTALASTTIALLWRERPRAVALSLLHDSRPRALAHR